MAGHLAGHSTAPAQPLQPGAGLNRPLITVSIMLATLMQSLDSTIANVALPHMQGALSASQDEITWVLTSYIVSAAIATPLTGWLATRFGVKHLLAASITGFTIASGLCGLADSLPQIIIARLLQGIFGASLVPLSQSILLDINPREKQGQAMAVWGMGVMVGPILGPTLGGWLTESYNWRWVFFINLPVGAFALFGTLAYLPENRRKFGERFDFFGFATLSLAVGALQALLDRGEQLDWFSSMEIRVEALLAVISFAFFIAHTATAGPRSFFRYQLLKDRNFVTGVFFIFVVGAVMYATRALLPPMLQSLMNYDAATAGFVSAPSGIGTMIAMMVVGRLIGRFDVRVLLVTGFLISAFALWQMTHYTLVLSPSDIVWPGVVQGFGLGLVFVPLSSVTFSTLSGDLRSDGTAIYSLMRNIGSSIGISVVQTFITRNTQVVHASLATHVSVYEPVVQSQVDLHSPGAIALLDMQITQQASMIAYIDDFKLMFIATLLVIPLLAIIRPARHSSATPADAHVAMD
ncbi:DHA2 family efflux MFS transporter permease subunit [Paraburkholderia aromaticivorans]|uniref:DHA2 family efflux MFS transporter permease subunit n=1 Tax=Paraburkholderia aromaticivorans TaxID=2026199 RepID=UPI001455F588